MSSIVGFLEEGVGDNVRKFFCGAQHNSVYDDVGDSVAKDIPLT